MTSQNNYKGYRLVACDGSNLTIATNPSVHEGVLAIGMLDNGECMDFNLTVKYVDFLHENGLFSFASNVENGFLSFVTDVEGKYLASVKAFC